MSPAAAAVLRTEELSVSYGGVHALVEANIEVRQAQLVGLIGPNGAGKTTFIDAVSGFTASRGKVELDGAEISRLAPHARARRGLARTWQSTELFDDLTVRENLAVAARPRGTGRLLRSILTGRPIEFSAVSESLALLGLDALADSSPANLSQGQRKLVGVARALAAQPAVLCLDEPAAGLDSEESRVLGERLIDVARSGTATLLVDHDMDLVLTVCNYVYVLDFGRLIAQGPPEEVRETPAVIDAYLGRPRAAVNDRPPADGGGAV
ncbi:MAG: ABC transporter ATP-binding protein [Solirubrobacteraceae bacterium]|jgi:branched-chain amino acid transport system ATP-binding protein